MSAEENLPEHGVTVVFVELGKAAQSIELATTHHSHTFSIVWTDNTKIELLHPFGDNSPIAKFLQNKPSGGIHHICIEARLSALASSV